MFCQKCGTQNDEGVNFCANCGASTAAVPPQPVTQQPIAPPPPPPVTPPQYAPPPVAQPQYTQPQYNQPQYAPAQPASQYAQPPVYAPPAVPKKKKTGLIAALGILFVLIIAAVLVILFAGGNAEKTTKDFLMAAYNFDYSVIEKNSFIDIEKYYEIEEDINAGELKDRVKETKDEAINDIEKEYGKNIKFDVKVTDSKELSKSDADDVIADYKEYEDYFKGDIKSVVEVTVDVTFKGDTSEDTNTLEIYAVKSGMKWYILSEISDMLLI